MTEVYNHLNDNGIFLLTLREEDVGDFKYKNDFCSNEMLWSYYGYDEYIKLLNEIGFKVLYSENQNKHGFDEGHNWLTLKKPIRVSWSKNKCYGCHWWIGQSRLTNWKGIVMLEENNNMVNEITTLVKELHRDKAIQVLKEHD